MNINFDNFFEIISNCKLMQEEKTAVFDFDGTLIRGDIEEAFFCYLLSRNHDLEYSWDEYNHLLDKGEYQKAYLDMKQSFSKLPISKIINEINNFLKEKIEHINFNQNNKEYKYKYPIVNNKMLQIVEFLIKNNFKIYIISASFEMIVREAAFAWFGIPKENIAGMRLKKSNEENFSNEIMDIVTIGSGKVDALFNYFNIQRPFLVAGDSIIDLELLNTINGKGIKIVFGNNQKLLENISKGNILKLS